MKIRAIRVREVSVPRIYDTYAADPGQLQAGDEHGRSRYQIIELHTDDGLTGLGEISDIYDRMAPTTAGETAQRLAQVLVGGEMARWRPLLAEVAQSLPRHIHPELRGLTLFGVEIAMLDLVGKRYSAPLYEILGGRVRDRVPVSWVAYLRGHVPLAEELEALSAEVEAKVREGLRAFKLKVGEDPERDAARVRRVRQLAGPQAHIKVDASGAWSHRQAVDQLRQLAAAGANSCETPVEAVSRAVANDDPERINSRADEAAASLARVRAASPIPLIEHVADLGDVFCAALVRHRAVDAVNVIPSQGGGLLRGLQLIHTAQTGGIPALLGSTIELGPGTAAFAHLGVAAANVSWPSDLVSPGLLVDDVIDRPFQFAAGGLAPPDGPGLGVVLDEERMARWEVGGQ